MFFFVSLDGAREWSCSHPSRAFGAVSRRAKVFPLSFLNFSACWKKKFLTMVEFTSV